MQCDNMSLTQQYSSSNSTKKFLKENKIDWIKLSCNPTVIELYKDKNVIYLY
jgi:hypothetical protein